MFFFSTLNDLFFSVFIRIFRSIVTIDVRNEYRVVKLLLENSILFNTKKVARKFLWKCGTRFVEETFPSLDPVQIDTYEVSFRIPRANVSHEYVINIHTEQTSYIFSGVRSVLVKLEAHSKVYTKFKLVPIKELRILSKVGIVLSRQVPGALLPSLKEEFFPFPR